MYYLLTSFVNFVNFLWVLFLVFGFLIVGRRPWIALLHFSGLLFSLFLNLFYLFWAKKQHLAGRLLVRK